MHPYISIIAMVMSRQRSIIAKTLVFIRLVAV